MITYIDTHNASKYTALFRDAEEALVKKWLGEGKDPTHPDFFGPIIEDPDTGERGYSNGISSLNTYFSWINDLLNITYLPAFNDQGEIIEDTFVDFDGMKFSMLPVDEEVFVINANERTITVPEAFNKNGISVQGDEISEVVYFKINRFYDATDLFNQDIMIEWIAPNGLKGYSVPTVRVLDQTTNFVIFGWALAGAITEKAGDVTFSVRFYKYDDDNNKIQYSLSTLTQKAKIQPNIGLDIPGLLGSEGHMEGYKVLGDEIKALIRERSENSNFGPNGDKAEVPFLYMLNIEPDSSNLPYVVVLAKDEVSDTWTATATGCGYSNDAGVISYFWKKFDYFKGDRLQTDGDNKLSYRDLYIKMNRDEAKALVTKIPSMKLWVPRMIEGKLVGYEERTIEEIENDASITEIYRFDSECTFDGVGYYKLVIKNRKGRATETFETDPIIVYPPNVPDELTITPRAFLNGDDEEKGVTVNYVIPSEPDKDPAFALNDPVKVGYRTADGAIVNKYVFDIQNEDVSYEWRFIPLGETEHKVVEGAEDAQTLNPIEEGDYFCRLRGLLNGAVSDFNDSPVSRVTYKPARPVFTLEGSSVINGNDIVVSNTPDLEMPEDFTGVDVGSYTIYAGRRAPIVLTYNIETMMHPANHQLTDKLTCQWYCYELERDANGRTIGSVDKEDCLKAVKGIYEPTTRDSIMWPSDRAVGEPFELTLNDLVADKEGTVTIDSEFMPEIDGYYFCIITNKYNEMEANISTPLAYYDNQDN